MKLSPGTSIAGLYRADRRIGVGGMGEVWAGVRLADNFDVAIKVLLGHTVDTNEVIARFRREAQVLALVRSRFVAQVIDFLAEEDGFVLVMELIPGDSLHAVLSYDQALAIETTLDIAADVLRGLRDLHNANIVHRDLKPGNIVLRPRPGLRPRATLIDFGVSRIMSDPDEEEVTAITRGDRVLGTLEYMAPEQILGSRSVTGTADLYAVGAMMYRAITGHHVFGDLQEGRLAVAKLNQDAPPLGIARADEVAERTQVLLSRLLSRRLRDRFKTAEEALSEVEAIRALVPDKRPDEQSLSLDEEHTRKQLKARAAARTSNSGPQIEVANIRAAVPIEDIEDIEDIEEVEPEPPSTASQVAASVVAQPAAQGGTPMGAEVPPRRPAQAESSPWRTLAVAFLLFVFGSVGGGLFGVSYARGGFAHQMIHASFGQAATAIGTVPEPQPAGSSALPEPPPAMPTAPVSSRPIVEMEEAPDAAADASDADDAGEAEALPSAAPQPRPRPLTPSPTPPPSRPPATAKPTPVLPPIPASPSKSTSKPAATPKPDTPPKPPEEEPEPLLPEEP